MSLRDLSTALMVCLTTPWVDRNHPDRAALESLPQSAGLMSSVDAAHNALLTVRSSGSASSDERLAEIKAEELSVNQRHGELVHGVWWFLSAIAALTSDSQKASAYTALRDRLMPDGLSIKTLSYQEKAGAAKLAQASLSDDDRALLASLSTPEGTLEGGVLAWFAAAARLGVLELERGRLEPQGATAADSLKARNNWIRVINAVRAALSTVEALPPPVTQALQSIENAEQKTAPRAIEQPEDDKQPVTPTDDTQPARNVQPVAPANDTHPTPVIKVA